MERRLHEIQLIGEGNIVDLLQPKIHLLDIEQPLVDGRAEILTGSVEKILDLINVWRILKSILWGILILQFIGRWLLPKLQLLGIR